MRGSFLSSPKEAHDRVSIFNSWRIASAGCIHNRQGKGSNRTKRETSFIRPVVRIWGAPSCKIQRSIIFYSHVHSNYHLFLMVEWMRNFFHLLEIWQIDNYTGTSAVWAATVKSWICFFPPPDSQESLSADIFLFFLSWQISCSLIDFPHPNIVHLKCIIFA